MKTLLAALLATCALLAQNNEVSLYSSLFRRHNISPLVGLLKLFGQWVGQLPASSAEQDLAGNPADRKILISDRLSGRLISL